MTDVAELANRRTAQAIVTAQDLRGLNDTAFALALGMKRQTLVPYLKGESRITVGLLAEIGEALDIAEAILMQGRAAVLRWAAEQEEGNGSDSDAVTPRYFPNYHAECSAVALAA